MKIEAVPYRTPACDKHLANNEDDTCPWCLIEELEGRIEELEAFLFNRSHICTGRDCVGILQEPTGSLPRCSECNKVVELRGQD